VGAPRATATGSSSGEEAQEVVIPTKKINVALVSHDVRCCPRVMEEILPKAIKTPHDKLVGNRPLYCSLRGL